MDSPPLFNIAFSSDSGKKKVQKDKNCKSHVKSDIAG